MLGLPPAWYKSAEYRSRMVAQPRATLREMGLDLPEDVHVRVWDSSAEARYMVLPERPAGAEDLEPGQLEKLATRDSLIGVARATAPGASGDA